MSRKFYHKSQPNTIVEYRNNGEVIWTVNGIKKNLDGLSLHWRTLANLLKLKKSTLDIIEIFSADPKESFLLTNDDFYL